MIDNGPPTGPIPIYYPALVPATLLARLSIWTWGAYAVWQGAGIANGGDVRWSAASFRVLTRLDHPTFIWGWALIICGILTLIGSGLQMMPKGYRRTFAGLLLKGAGLGGIAVWSICLAWGGLAAAHAIPTVSTTTGPTYVALAVQVIVLMFVDERVSRRVDHGR